MAGVDTPQLKFDPYTPQVPVLQIPQQDMQPGGPLPLQAGFMGKTGGVAEVGDQILKGFMRGRQEAAVKKAQVAQNSINISQQNEQGAWKTYQDSLRTGQSKPGDANDPAYQAYMKAHQGTTEVMEKYAIPEEKPKGQKKKDQQQKPKDGEQPQQPQGVAHKFAEFLKANPHVIPQLAIATRTPNKPVMEAETQETQNKLTMQAQSIESNKQAIQEQKETAQRQQQERGVEEAGGYEKVLSEPNAPPELQQAAKRIKFSALDKTSPEGRMKYDLMQQAMTNPGSMTPAQRQMAGSLGIMPEPKEVTVAGKNGHKQMMLVDPTTNQQIPGSKPLDLGAPEWAQQFYGERAAKKNDLRKAVAGDPAAYGVQLTGDKKTDAARIDATAYRLFTDHEEGIKSASNALAQPAGEIYRNNAILSDVDKQVNALIPKDKRDKTGAVIGKGTADFAWPGDNKPVSLSHADASGILNQFITDRQGEYPGIYTFREKPQLQAGKDAGAAERDRQWALKLVRDRMLAQKGTKTQPAMTPEQVDGYLSKTALGMPITADQVVAAPPPPPPPPKGSFRKFMEGVAGITGPDPDAQPKAGSLRGGPPTGSPGSAPGGAKVYIVDGQAMQLSPEDAEKLEAAGYSPEEASPELSATFAQ